MSIFKTRSFSWKQVAAIKWATLAAGMLIAYHWPVVASWTILWWIVLVVLLIYIFSFYFKK